VAAGTRLQLPLYAAAARARFAPGSATPVLARYWLLSSERSAPGYHLVVTEEVEARFRRVIGLIAQGIEDGCFPGVSGPALFDGRFENCRTCDFDSVCPADREQHWNRKLGDPRLRPVMGLLHEDVSDSLAGTVVKGFVDPEEEHT
jgi:ATP-dependent helicase/nuclease subunit B